MGVPELSARSSSDADLIDQAGCPASGCSFFQTTVFFADADIGIQIGVFTDADTFPS